MMCNITWNNPITEIFSYMWRKIGQSAPFNETSNTLIIPFISKDDYGTYSCDASDGFLNLSAALTLTLAVNG